MTLAARPVTGQPALRLVVADSTQPRCQTDSAYGHALFRGAVSVGLGEWCSSTLS